MRPVASFFVLALAAAAVGPLAAGCGRTPPRTPPGTGAGADAGAPLTMESQREPFMRSCLKTARSEAYCQCGFGEFRRIFAHANVSRPLAADDPRLVELNESTVAACGSRLTEDDVRVSFVEGCVRGEESKRAYCECAWTQLRKRWSTADFLGGANAAGPKLEEAKRQMAAVCKGTLPAGLVRDEFVRSCLKNATAPACECMWKKIIAQYSPEEIEGGQIDRGRVPALAACR